MARARNQKLELELRDPRIFVRSTGWGGSPAIITGGDTRGPDGSDWLGLEVDITGSLVGFHAGDAVSASGYWSRYKGADQFSATILIPRRPTTRAGVERWLRRLPGIGPAAAASLVERYGPEGVFEALEGNPEELLEERGITPARLALILEEYGRIRGGREARSALYEYGLTDNQIGRVMNHLDTEDESVALAEVQKNPFMLARSVRGFGFKTADKIARAMGYPHDGAFRVQAGIFETVVQWTSRGHTFIPGKLLVIQACELLQLPSSKVRPHVRTTAGIDIDERLRVALRHHREDEDALARLLARGLQ